ncbi:MAG: alpha/beta fold hydrolase [Ilumatobacteraceae bacterium]|jgi:pimeloyl-ACP methyl ester carboxylesterase
MQFDERHLDINGIDTAVFTAGEGDAVVLFHGAGTATGFDCLLPIAEHNQLVVAHHPGFGASGDSPYTNVADLARHQLDVLDALGIERFALVGHSMGGWTAVTLASFSTARLTKLVLVAPAGLDSAAHPITDLLAVPADELLSYLAADLSIFGPMDGPPPPEFLAARAREADTWATISRNGVSDPNLGRWLHRIDVPTLLLWGDADRIVPVGQSTEWLAALPNATITTFAGAGHLLFDERTDAVTAVAEFVRA